MRLFLMCMVLGCNSCFCVKGGVHYTVKARKKVYYEWMRIIAIGLVIFNHLNGYHLYMKSSGFKQAIYMFLTMLTRINVPLFFMISGGLLLGKNEDFITVLKKRITRFCLIILIFELGIYLEYYIAALIKGQPYDFTIKRFIYGVFSMNLDGTGSYWYLYSYLGLLVSLPFIQKIARNIKRQDIYALMILHFIFSSLIPIINIILIMMKNEGIQISRDFSIPLATAKAYFYPLLGYYLEYQIDIASISEKKIYKISLIAFIGIVLSCLCTFYEGKTTGKYTQNYVQLFDYVTTIAVFMIIKYAVTIKFPELSKGKISYIVCLIGSLTLGIYLLDPYIKVVLYGRYERITEPYLPTVLVSIGWCLISMILGGSITYLLKKLFIFRKIL